MIIIPKHRLQYVLIKEILEEGKNLILAGDQPFKINLVVINLIMTIMAKLSTCYVCYVIAGDFLFVFYLFYKGKCHLIPTKIHWGGNKYSHFKRDIRTWRLREVH